MLRPMECPGCSAVNPNDARFCNMCGRAFSSLGVGREGGGAANQSTQIGQIRGPEAPLGVADTARASSGAGLHAQPPSMSQSSMSISLDGIGVRSAGRTWAIVFAFAIGMMAVGAGAMWFVSKQASDTPPEDPSDSVVAGEGAEGFDVGDPMPTGAATPEVDFISGAPRPRAGATEIGTKAIGSSGTTTHLRPSSGGGTGRQSATGIETATGTPRPAPTGASTATGTATPTGTATATGAATGTETATGTAMAPDTAAAPPSTPIAETEEDERDIMGELYAAQVRNVVRQYYAPRTRQCFDRATRDNTGLRGTVVVGFTIRADGQVADTAASRNSTGDEALGRCLVNQVATWRLPAPPGGEMQLEIPFSR